MQKTDFSTMEYLTNPSLLYLDYAHPHISLQLEQSGTNTQFSNTDKTKIDGTTMSTGRHDTRHISLASAYTTTPLQR